MTRGVAAALDENAEEIGAEGQALLLDSAYDWVQRRFPPDFPIVPADYPLAAETFRVLVADYATREPLEEEEQARLETQLGEVYEYAQELWAASSVADVESAGDTLEAIWKDWEWEMESPLGRHFKQPFTDEQLEVVMAAMEQEAREFQEIGALPPGRRQARAARLVSDLLEPLWEVAAEYVAPQSDELKRLVQRQNEQEFAVETEKLRKIQEGENQERAAESETEQTRQRLYKQIEALLKESADGSGEISTGVVVREPSNALPSTGGLQETMAEEATGTNPWMIALALGGCVLAFGAGLLARRVRR